MYGYHIYYKQLLIYRVGQKNRTPNSICSRQKSSYAITLRMYTLSYQPIWKYFSRYYVIWRKSRNLTEVWKIGGGIASAGFSEKQCPIKFYTCYIHVEVTWSDVINTRCLFEIMISSVPSALYLNQGIAANHFFHWSTELLIIFREVPPKHCPKHLCLNIGIIFLLSVNRNALTKRKWNLQYLNP